MLTFVAATALAFGAIFLAEFGDRSQLLVLALATRYPWRPVVAGLVIAAAIIQGISVAIGGVVGAALPTTTVAVVSWLAFIGVALWTLRGEDEEGSAGGREGDARTRGMAVVLAVAAAFLVAELGDKTMLATFAIAASQGLVSTWIGSTAGEVAANLVAVAVGRHVGHRLSPRLVRIGSAALFAIAGMAVLIGALVGAS